jgi:hypothetical protein
MGKFPQCGRSARPPATFNPSGLLIVWSAIARLGSIGQSIIPAGKLEQGALGLWVVHLAR